MLDERLKEILSAFMLQSKTSDELLSGFNAPLGAFSARASAAFAFGLIQETSSRKSRSFVGYEMSSGTTGSRNPSNPAPSVICVHNCRGLAQQNASRAPIGVPASTQPSQFC
jgi:hypothetical protein